MSSGDETAFDGPWRTGTVVRGTRRPGPMLLVREARLLPYGVVRPMASERSIGRGTGTGRAVENSANSAVYGRRRGLATISIPTTCSRNPPVGLPLAPFPLLGLPTLDPLRACDVPAAIDRDAPLSPVSEFSMQKGRASPYPSPPLRRHATHRWKT